MTRYVALAPGFTRESTQLVVLAGNALEALAQTPLDLCAWTT
ncbi:hypothetical protein [Kribbella swartbergensis]